jgi:hypothetical protein
VQFGFNTFAGFVLGHLPILGRAVSNTACVA